tara:strand:- start:3080 stop:3655 length:576 start_codon:yes stop_codon:yes gene_type:complete
MKDKIINRLNEYLSLEISKKLYKDFVKDKLSSKVVKITITDTPFEVFLNFSNEEISISLDSDKMDVEISGSFMSFIFYATSGGSDLFSSKITISGDVESANALNSFFKESDIIRFILVELVGQKSASSIFSFLDPMKIKLDESNKTYNEALSNFLKYDINLIPTKKEINDYIDQVDDIKSRTDKLLKKINE